MSEQHTHFELSQENYFRVKDSDFINFSPFPLSLQMESPTNNKASWGELLFSGSLEKRSLGRNAISIKNWKRRYFELYETRFVYYLSSCDALTTEPKGTFILDESTEFGNAKLSPFCLFVKADMKGFEENSARGKNQKLYMRSESCSMKEEWIAALKIAVDMRKEVSSCFFLLMLMSSLHFVH